MALTKDDLLAISGIVQAQVDPLRQDMKEMKADMKDVKERIGGLELRVDRLEQGMSELRQDVSGLKQDVSSLKQDVSGLKQDVSGLKQNVSELRQDMKEVKDRVGNLEQDTRIIKLQLENQIVPRLYEIESCYLSTSKRYQEDADWMENAKTDFEVMQQTVKEHSAKFKRLEKVI